jgi:hypothetical protein
VTRCGSPYADLRARLVERCRDGDGECWVGTDKTSTSIGYQQLDIHVPGLRISGRRGSARRKVYAHIALWCWDKWSCVDANELWLAYREFRESGLELDHECEEPACRNPAHLQPVTHVENLAASRERRASRLDQLDRLGADLGCDDGKGLAEF